MMKGWARGAAALAVTGLLATGSALADSPKVAPELMRKAQESYIAAINNKDLPAILALYADDAVIEDPVGSAPKKGRQAIEAFYAGVVKGGPKLELVAVNPSQGDSSAMFFQVKAGPVTINVIDVMVFNAAGKITNMYAYVNQAPAAK